MIPAAAIPIGLEAAAGIAGLIQGGSQRKKGRGLMQEAEKLHSGIPMEDYRQVSYLDDIRTRQKAMEAGTSKLMGLRTRQAQNAQAQTQANAARQSGGSVGSLMDVLLGAQRVTGDTLNEGAAQEQQQAMGLLQMQGPLITDMAQRKYAHQKYLRDVKMGQGAQLMQDAAANTAGGIGMLGSAGINALSALDYNAGPRNTLNGNMAGGSMNSGVSGMTGLGAGAPGTTAFNDPAMRGMTPRLRAAYNQDPYLDQNDPWLGGMSQ